MSTVSDLTESELIARIQERLAPAPAWLLVGIGDDAAVVEGERGRLEVLTVDALVEGVHFVRRFTPPDAIGHRALAANLSDLAAMGAAPRLALLSFALPAGLAVADFDRLVGALAGLACRHRLHVVGGNLARSPGPLMIDVTVAGTVKPRQVLTRAGARPGDEIYVTGTIGAAAAGLQMLQDAAGDSRLDPAEVRLKAPFDYAQGGLSKVERPDATGGILVPCVRRYLYPEPRIRAGLLLSRNRAATACVDLSDGLADGVSRLAEASRVGAIIDAAALPVDPDTREWFETAGKDAVLEAVTGGDDYELLFAVRPRLRGRLNAAMRQGGVPVTRVGVCTEDRSVILRRTGPPSETAMPRGYTHFR
jgi:thiamine-monophosphate kinase